MPRYRDSLKRISLEIRNDRISLEAQLKYFEYILNGGATEELEVIDRKIVELDRRREKVVSDFKGSTQKIKELVTRLRTLDIKKRKLLVDPKIQRMKELMTQLQKLGVEIV